MSVESNKESPSYGSEQPPSYKHQTPNVDRQMEKLNRYSEPSSLDYSHSSSVFESEEPDCTNFESDAFERESGVESADGDWPRSCDTPPDFDLDLTEEQALETLKYFSEYGSSYLSMSFSRANQMTKTHQDLDAVLQLLQEKEKDLELAASIGQTLLERNQNLYKKTEALENYVNEVEERETQLKHVVSMKNKLLKTFADDEDEEDYSLINRYSDSSAYDSCKDESMLSLHDKCDQLEQQNSSLIVEALKLREETDKEEDKEKELVYECIKELGVAKEQISHLTDEISLKAEDNIEQQEEISKLISTVLDLQDSHNHLTEENEGLHETLKSSQENQKDLQTEVSTLHEKYKECFELLMENQREMKMMKVKLGSHDSSVDSDSSSPGLLRQDPRDSLAQEIEQSVRRDLETSQEKKKHTNRVMQTVRAANPAKRFPKAIKGGSRPTKSGQAKAGDKPFDFTFAVSANSSKKGKEAPSMDELRAAVRRLSVSENTPQAQRGRRSWAPEKLQIVKPMEGSATLHKWQSLARPTMSGLHTVLPGVHVKGETAVQIEHTEDDSAAKSGDVAAGKHGKHQSTGSNKSNVLRTAKGTAKDEKVKTTREPEKQSVETRKHSKQKQVTVISKTIPPNETSTIMTSKPSHTLDKPVTSGVASNLTEIVKSKLSSEQAVTPAYELGPLLSNILRSTAGVSAGMVNTMPVTTVAKSSFVPTTTTTSVMSVTAFPRPLHVRSRSSENLLNLMKPLSQPNPVEATTTTPSSRLSTESPMASQGFGGFVGRLVRSSSSENLAATKNAEMGFSRSSSSGKLSDLVKNAELYPTIGKASSFDTVQKGKRAPFHLGASPPSPSRLEEGFSMFAPSSSGMPAADETMTTIPSTAASTSKSMFSAFSSFGGFFRPRSKSLDNLGPLPASFSSPRPIPDQKNNSRSSRVERSLKRFNQAFGPD